VHKGKGKHILVFKTVAVVVAFFMLFNDTVSAFGGMDPYRKVDTLSPKSRFSYDGNFVPGKETSGLAQITGLFEEDIQLAYASRLIAKALETAKSSDNLSEKALRTLLKRHFRHIEELNFEVDTIQKKDNTFCLDYSGRTDRTYRLSYYLPSDISSDILDDRSLPVPGVSSARVIVEEFLVADGFESEVRLLLPVGTAETSLSGDSKETSDKERESASGKLNDLIKEIDVSKDTPPEVYSLSDHDRTSDGKRPKKNIIRKLFAVSLGMLAIIAVVSVADTFMGTAPAIGPVSEIVKTILVSGVMLAGMVSARQRSEDLDEIRFMDLINDIISNRDEYLKMAAARDILKMPIPSELDTDGYILDLLADRIAYVFMMSDNEYVRSSALEYLIRFGTVHLLSKNIWQFMLKAILEPGTSEDMRKRLLMFFSRTEFIHKDLLGDGYRAAQGVLVMDVGTNEHRMAIKMMGNILNFSDFLKDPGKIGALKILEELAYSGTFNYYSLGSFYVMRKESKVFESPGLRIEAIEQVYNVFFTGALRFFDLALLYKGDLNKVWENAEGTDDRDTDRGEGKEEEGKSLMFLAVYVNGLFRTFFEKLCFLMAIPGQQDEIIRAKSARVLSAIFGKWINFLATREKEIIGFPEKMAFSLLRERNINFVENRMMGLIYGESSLFEEENKTVVMSIADIFLTAAENMRKGIYFDERSIEKMTHVAERSAERLFSLVFDSDAEISEKAKRMILSFKTKFPDLMNVSSFNKLARYIERDGVDGHKVRMLSVLPWIIIAGAVVWDFIFSTPGAGGHVIAGMIGLGTILVNARTADTERLMLSEKHMLSAAARSVSISRDNDDITTGLESRLQMCSVRYLTDPDNVDLTAALEDIPHVYTIMDSIMEGKVINADLKPIKIHVRPGKKIEIWEGKHRLEALKRLGVGNVPVHVVYFDRSLVGRHPFEDIVMHEVDVIGSEEERESIKNEDMGPRLLEKAREENRTKEVLSVDETMGFAFMDVKDTETWGIYAPTPLTVSLGVLFYIKSIDPNAKICDIGSGLGRFCFLAAVSPSLRFPSVTGIEGREDLYLEAVGYKKGIQKIPGGENVDLIHGDFFEQDLSGYDFLYFFFTHPSEETAEFFGRKLLEKLTSSTGLRLGAKLIMWGDPHDISDGTRLVSEKISIGSNEMRVYTRLGESTPSDTLFAADKDTDIGDSINSVFGLYGKNDVLDIDIEIEEDLPRVHAEGRAAENIWKILMRTAIEQMERVPISGQKPKLKIRASTVTKDGGNFVEVVFSLSGSSPVKYSLDEGLRDVGRMASQMGWVIEEKQLQNHKKSSFDLPENELVATFRVNEEKKYEDISAKEVAGDLFDAVMLRNIESGTVPGNTILIVSTSWMSGYDQDSLAYGEMTSLMSEIRSFCRRRGITMVASKDDMVASDLNRELSSKGNAGAKVIILAGEETVRSEEFKKFRDNDNVFIAGVNGHTGRMLELIVLALKLGSGYGSDNITWAGDIRWQVDPARPNMLIFILPSADPMGWDDPARKYKLQREALIRA
jgi:hypothetical protein